MDGLRKRNTKKVKKNGVKVRFYLKKNYLYLGHLWRIPLKLKDFADRDDSFITTDSNTIKTVF